MEIKSCFRYDDETGILHFNGWKFFQDLPKEDRACIYANDS
jgi:hypothetical protein